MKKERPYEFRNHLDCIHEKNRRDFSIKATKNELAVKNGWEILIDYTAPELIEAVAKDLQDYFSVSMDVSVMLRKVANIADCTEQKNSIIMATAKELKSFSGKFPETKSYCLKVNKNIQAFPRKNS